jgi:hypothetical protein
MKTIPSLRGHHYLRSTCILLIAVALVTAIVSCNGEPTPTRYNLTMAVDPLGYGTAVDVTGAGAYEAGTVVDIQATANPGNQFVIWSTTGGTLGDENATTTNLTMPAQNVTVTAHFVGPVDHFTCYDVEGEVPPLEKDVGLEDQFIAIDTTVMEPELFCNPVEKYYDGETTYISNDENHYTLYSLDYPEEEWGTWFVEVDNQFGTQNLTVVGPVLLAVPTTKEGHGDHVGLDHLLVYFVEVEEAPPIGEVALTDQFGGEPDATVLYPVLFANPVRKTYGTEVTEIFREPPQDHMVFYVIGIEEPSSYTQVQIDNQFGEQSLNLSTPAELLAVPSTKVNFGGDLDHFKFYPYGTEPPSIDEDVHLKDQFVDVMATVEYPGGFCNPVEKEIIEGPPPIPIFHDENHLTVYEITLLPPDERYWFVVVENQFGIEELYVTGPVALAVPTQKLEPGDHGPPVHLDHLLLYAVISEPSVLEAPVILHDQFGSEGATVWAPILFANPVEKEHATDVTLISNPWEHLLFYEITGTEIDYDTVTVVNQFGPPTLGPFWAAEALAVPSLKLFAEEVFP